MSRATFTRRPCPELGPGVVRYTLDCLHGTTHGDVIPAGGCVPTDRQVLAILALRHERAERCGCTRRLLVRTGAGAGTRTRGSGGAQ